ncbi:MAG: hypothetical protein HYR94_15475 [Chloroflexi bacterium]|nr:hypothetical protein [Chloroflexota bacterium]
MISSSQQISLEPVVGRFADFPVTRRFYQMRCAAGHLTGWRDPIVPVF